MHLIFALLRKKRKPLPGPNLNSNAIEGLQTLADIFQNNKLEEDNFTSHQKPTPQQNQKTIKPHP